MMQLQIYSPQDLPIQLKWQIYAFIRMEWPTAFHATEEILTSDCYHPCHFLFADGDLLMSHVAVVWKQLIHAGQTYKTYGLVSVMTFPDHRNQGYGMQVILKAKNYIEQTDGDIVFFHSGQVGFYEKAGFEYTEKVKVLKGDPDHPEPDDQRPYMLFLSEKAKNHRIRFETKPLYFGKNVW